MAILSILLNLQSKYFINVKVFKAFFMIIDIPNKNYKNYKSLIYCN